jgi:hypothetical protein
MCGVPKLRCRLAAAGERKRFAEVNQVVSCGRGHSSATKYKGQSQLSNSSKWWPWIVRVSLDPVIVPRVISKPKKYEKPLQIHPAYV